MFDPWQQRVLDEKDELDGRIVRLSKAIADKITDDAEHLDLMRRQLWSMEAYSATLRQRIALFEKG